MYREPRNGTFDTFNSGERESCYSIFSWKLFPRKEEIICGRDKV